MGSFTFSIRQRLRHQAEFEHVYRSGQRFAATYFQAAACANTQGFARLGLAVAVRTAGNSVSRNRIRRAVREVFRLQQHELPAMDFVVSCRARARDASAPELRADLQRLFANAGSRPAAHTPS